MARELLIDGYNLMHAAGLARARYGPGGLERSRHALLRLVSGQLNDEQRRRTTVVFDAKDPPPNAGVHGTHAEMLVLYATEEEEADDLIEHIIAAHSAPKQLIVVSSDHRLHKAARRRKATPLDSDDFLDDCARRVYCRTAKRPEPELKPDCDTSAAAVADWLTVFDVDVLDMSRQIDRAPVLPKPVSSPKQKQQQPSQQQPPQSQDSAQQPKSRKRGPRSGKRSRSRPEPHQPLDDLSFWEARIADLFRRHPEEFGEER